MEKIWRNCEDIMKGGLPGPRFRYREIDAYPGILTTACCQPAWAISTSARYAAIPSPTNATITRWLQRAGTHSLRCHERYFRHLVLAVVQLDELHTRTRGLAHARWLWLTIDPISKVIPALYLGRRRNVDAYTLLHQLKKRLAPDCVPIFLSDGFRAYFSAITAHFGHWFRPPRARKDHWQVDQKLLYGHASVTAGWFIP